MTDELPTIRDQATRINELFTELLPTPRIINTGSQYGAGDGDTLDNGFQKIIDNLVAVKLRYLPSAESLAKTERQLQDDKTVADYHKAKSSAGSSNDLHTAN